jgi:hypothetical protein
MTTLIVAAENPGSFAVKPNVTGGWRPPDVRESTRKGPSSTGSGGAAAAHGGMPNTKANSAPTQAGVLVHVRVRHETRYRFSKIDQSIVHP